ncbi:MAG: Vitamin B12-dependent ribonucleotide reductase [Candidatus Heimdallarchaeota archaeon LC_2]|nr:MAG: Vitamin B12-dependent ribonucleotide reductase [Candidatus Heimdallarchaeota archaeon LC_2]
MSLLQDYDPSTGLQFKRFYTEEGVHPYEKIKWETRDVLVTSATGDVIFSQKRVEFPSNWTINASQIVTSKYFHGRLGKPERETSLKQLIDRVVNTVGKWGLEGKYFKSELNKNIFVEELTHILLNQHASFNSPVWFNMGTLEKPQSSACQPYNSLINTTQGLIPIGEIVEENLIGLPVYDSKGITQVLNVMHNGKKDVFKLVLNDGHFVEVTGDHLVCVHSERRTKRLEWKRVDQLEIGEYMRVYTKKAKTFTPPCEDRKFVSEAALAGWLQADGFVGQYETGTNKSLTLEFIVINEDEEQWVKTHLENVFPDVHFNEIGVESKTHEGLIIANRIRLYGEVLREFVQKYELLNRGKHIRIPKIIYTAPNDVVRAYLRSVFESDGYISNNGTSSHLALATISKNWMEDVVVLLSRFGIYSRLRQKRENRSDRYDMWEVDISIHSERKAFASEINFISTRKQDKLTGSLRTQGKKCPKIRYQKIVEIVPTGKSDVYDIQTNSGNYLTNSILVHNCFINSVEDTMDSILDLAKTEGLIFKYGSGSGVNLSKLRAKGESLSTGGTSSGPISFMKGYDSFAGSIKSGGKCYKKGTLVSTPDGLIPIQDLAIGDLVLTHEGTRPINDFMINGKKQCFLVQTIEGYNVEVTAGHKFAYWHAELGNFLTKPIEEFKEGEQLYLLLQPSLGGKEILLTHPERTYQKHETTTNEMKLPKILNDKFAYILGLMYGDGNITEELWRIRISFSIDETGMRSIDQFLSYCRDLFKDEPFKQEGRGNYVIYNYTRKRLLQLLQINSLAKGKGDNLQFPKQLFTAKPNIRSSFIAGYFDADGNYQRRGGFSFSSIDPVYLKNIQKLLLTLGIPSKLKVTRAETGNWKTLYRLYVVGSTFTQLFANHIGQYSVKVQDQFIPSNKTNKGWGYRDIEYGDIHQWGVKGTRQFIERKLGHSNPTVGYGGVVAISEKFPEEVVGLISSRLSQCVPVTLKTVSPSEIAETYDIEVAGEHLLSANGIYASNTRRAAKMVLLDVWHPDVIDFIDSKANEEKKAWALIDAGYDGSFTGEAYSSVFFQNANHSIRVTDEFMDNVLTDGKWDLKKVTNNDIVRSIKAREILNKVSEATHLCGDPGLQYSTTINKWHTCKVSGPINASNPCVTGDTKILLPDGRLKRIDQLIDQPTEISTNLDGRIVSHSMAGSFSTGNKPVYLLTTKSGYKIKLTADHRIWTENRGFVEARFLEKDDFVRLAVNPTPQFEEIEDKEFYQMIGLYLGDGHTSKVGGTDRLEIKITMAIEEESILQKIEDYVAFNFERKTHKDNPSTVKYQNNVAYYTTGASSVIDAILQYVDLSRKSHEKYLSDEILNLPLSEKKGILQGLFTADGTVSNYGDKSQYISLDSTSLELLQGVQLTLLNFGVKSKLYLNRRLSNKSLLPDGKGGLKEYSVRQMHSLRISRSSRINFEKYVGFLEGSSKNLALKQMNQNVSTYLDKPVDRVYSLDFIGDEDVYDLTESVTNSFIANGITVHNCSEYVFLDDTACNLASINLMKYRNEDGSFNVDAFIHTVNIIISAQEIIVGRSSYPTTIIEENSHIYRTLGIGYTNLGALLMSLGLAYDSDEARNMTAAITSLMTGQSYLQSSKIAANLGAFSGYSRNSEAMLTVMNMHRNAANKLNSKAVDENLFEKAQSVWTDVVEHGIEYGYRNAQVSVIAPTGTISFMMDADTTGIEPDIALIKYKKLVGGGYMKIINTTVPLALKQLGYLPKEIDTIINYINEKGVAEGAPGLKEPHLSVFDCSIKSQNSTRTIPHMAHVTMMAAAQPFISGAISKTVNMPEDSTIDDINEVYIKAWQMGVKAVAIYRDNSKRLQPLNTEDESGTKADIGKKYDEVIQHPGPIRRRLPETRDSKIHKFEVNGHEGYIIVGLYDDETPGEVFVKMSKQGSTLGGVMDTVAVLTSMSLQYGVPLSALIRKFIHSKFEPSGMTKNPKIPIASSIIDYIFRWLALEFLPKEERPGIIDYTELTEEDSNPTQVYKSVSPAVTGSTPTEFVDDNQICFQCGAIAIRSGSCYACPECGSTSGCS